MSLVVILSLFFLGQKYKKKIITDNLRLFLGIFLSTPKVHQKRINAKFFAANPKNIRNFAIGIII